MDFITELPESSSYDTILVVVDKLIKYATFIPTNSTVDEKETAELFFKNIVTQYGLPRQIVTNRDSRWIGLFWKEVCKKTNIQRALTTVYHPQADRQTEVMNKTLETALRSYVNPALDNWAQLLHLFAVSYNNMPHSSTSFSPSFLLYGYHPITASTLLQSSEDSIHRPYLSDNNSALNSKDKLVSPQISESFKADTFLDEFKTFRDQAK